MKLGGRISAAIEVLADIDKRRRPATDALKDWGLSHRFAGSGDRAAIGNLVFDSLRWKASSGWRMDTSDARGIVLATLVYRWSMAINDMSASFGEDRHAPEVLSDAERQLLTEDRLIEAPGWVVADIPEWTSSAFQENFDDDYVLEGEALAMRPPVDLRVNTLLSDQETVLNALSAFQPTATETAPHGVRIKPPAGFKRAANVQIEAGFQKGWFEIQDEASQIASVLIGARPGEKILDLCAGGGGKTLALSMAMENKGQIHAFDRDKRRLAPIYERLRRAGTQNVNVIDPSVGIPDELKGTIDRVVIDAPCTGSGVWRRRPDAKWRLSEKSLEDRMKEQAAILDTATNYVRPGGYICYITCSMLMSENEAQISAFLERTPGFELLSVGEVWQDLIGYDKRQPWSSDYCSITMTPASMDTDGFFFSVLGKTTD